jgi:hypothetical protein
LASGNCNDFGEKGKMVMGGYNSGSNQRRSRYGRADSTWALDVTALHRAGWLKPGHWGTYRPGLNLLAKEGQLTLMYDATFKDGTQRPVGEIYNVVSSPRHFGGSVPYLICPGNGCGRRVSKLYRNTGRFRCRQCSKLVYDCQYENWVDRTLRRQDKITKKLGINHRAIAEPSQRPKHMRRKTYERLVYQLQTIEDRWEI